MSTDAAQRLGQRLAEMHQVILDLKAAEDRALKARNEASVAEWKTFLNSTGPVEQRKIQARHDTAALAFAADQAEGEVRHLVRLLREAEKRVDVGRTYSADLRAEAAVAGRDGTP